MPSEQGTRKGTTSEQSKQATLFANYGEGLATAASGVSPATADHLLHSHSRSRYTALVPAPPTPLPSSPVYLHTVGMGHCEVRMMTASPARSS